MRVFTDIVENISLAQAAGSAAVALLFNLFLHAAVNLGTRRSARENAKEVLRGFYTRVSAGSAAKAAAYNEIVQEEGRQEKIPFMVRVSDLLSQSEVSRILPGAPAEVFLMIGTIIAIAIGTVSGIFAGGVVFGFIGFAAAALAEVAIVQVLADRAYGLMEGQISMFLNYAESYSEANDDIVSIIFMASANLSGPLARALNEFHEDALVNGKDEAFLALEHKLAHPLMKEIVHNLYVCSNYNSDYKTVIADAHGRVGTYLKGKADRRAVRSEARADIFIISLGGFVCLWIFQGMLDNGSVIATLQATAVGSVLLFLLAVIILYAVYECIRTDKKV